MDLWIVKYSYRGSRYFDSPMYRSIDYHSFKTYEEAHAWAEAEHPDIPRFKVESVYFQKEIIPKARPMSATEAHRASDRSTDVCIVRGFSRFR